MDLSHLSAKVKGFQRRTTQKVLQQMGIAEKTEDDSQSFQNFTALGSFTAQLKATIQATDISFEKACTAQTHLAGQIQSYLHSELSGDTDLPPGELHDFFSNSGITDSQVHAVVLQDASEKFYSACSEIGNQALRNVMNQLQDVVVKPILKDEELNAITKELIEEKKKATLDYDSYRRLAASNSTPADQERLEGKLRMAKEKFDTASRRVSEHIVQRNQIRCKLLVHGILTAVQQYSNYYAAAAEILQDTAKSIKPLLDIYQMSEMQLYSTINLEGTLKSSGERVKSPPKPGGKANAEYLFAEHEAQSNNNYNNHANANANANANNYNNINNSNNNHAANRPKPPTSKPSAGQPPRVSSPQPPSKADPVDEMMQQSIAGMKKPAAAFNPAKTAPMNQQSAKSTPPPTRHNSNHQNQSNPISTSQNTPPPPTQNTPPPPPSQNPPAQPNLVDPFGEWSDASATTPPAQSADFLVDLDTPTRPQPASPPAGLFDDFINFSSPPLQPSSAPPMQPNSFNPLQPNVTPHQRTNSPLPNANKPAPSPTPANQPMRAQPGYGPSFSFQGGAPPSQQNPNFPRPQPGYPPNNAPPQNQNANFGAGFGFDFGQPPQGYPQQPPPATQSHVPSTQEERQELNPAVTEKIRNWAERGGRKTNLRALLSTLHEVIWVDSGWDGLTLTDLITAAQVKKAYRRANLIVHPDKVANGTVEQQLIAQRLFEALRLSYETFKDEPQ